MQTASSPATAISGEVKKLNAGSSANPLVISARPGTYEAFSSIVGGYGLMAGYCQAPLSAPPCTPGLDDIVTLSLSSCWFAGVAPNRSVNCGLSVPLTRNLATVVVFRYPTVTALADVSAKAKRLEPDTTRVIQRAGNFPSELTPDVWTTTNGTRKFLLGGNPSWLCDDHSGAPATGPIWMANTDCQNVLIPQILQLVGAYNGKGGSIIYKDPTKFPIPARTWNFSYDGAFGYGIVAGTDPTKSTIYFLRNNEHQNSEGVGPHGENYSYPGTIYPDVTMDPPGYVDSNGQQKHCASSPKNGWEHCWISFADFISLASAPYDMQTGALGPITDLGPVLWPATGYIFGPNGQPAYMRDQNGNPICKKDPQGNCVKDAQGQIVYLHQATGFGFYGVSMFADQNYLYGITSNTTNLEPGRPWGGCYTIARAPKSNPSVTNWRWYLNGRWESPTLPTGYTEEKQLAKARWLKETAGKATCLFQNDRDWHSGELMLNIAKVRGTSWYIGVHERNRTVTYDECLSYYDAATCRQYDGKVKVQETALRYTQDLVHWSDEQVIDAGANPADPTSAWGWNKYDSPVLFDSKWGNSQEIDANDFYVLGKQVFTKVPGNPNTGAGDSYQIWSAHLKIKNGPWGPNPPTQP
jgi:hypothetical protein